MTKKSGKKSHQQKNEVATIPVSIPSEDLKEETTSLPIPTSDGQTSTNPDKTTEQEISPPKPRLPYSAIFPLSSPSEEALLAEIPSSLGSCHDEPVDHKPIITENFDAIRERETFENTYVTG